MYIYNFLVLLSISGKMQKFPIFNIIVWLKVSRKMKNWIVMLVGCITKIFKTVPLSMLHINVKYNIFLSKHFLKYAWLFASQLNAAMSSLDHLSQYSSSQQIFINDPASIFELKNCCWVGDDKKRKGDNFFESTICMLSNPFLNYQHIIPIILIYIMVPINTQSQAIPSTWKFLVSFFLITGNR